MTAFRLTLIALATASSMSIANADESRAADEPREVVVVTAPRPVTVEDKTLLAEEIELRIDYSKLELEAPRLEPAAAEPRTTIDLVVRESTKSKS